MQLRCGELPLFSLLPFPVLLSGVASRVKTSRLAMAVFLTILSPVVSHLTIQYLVTVPLTYGLKELQILVSKFGNAQMLPWTVNGFVLVAAGSVGFWEKE